MTAVLQGLFGGGDSGAKAAIAAQQAQIKSDTGQQLRTVSQQQAATDNETASLSKPGLGRAMLTFQNRNTSGPSATLGG